MKRSTLVKKVDDAFGRYIKARDGRCVTCGRMDNLDCSHIIRKSRGHFHRWTPDNAAAQCRTCHTEHHRVSEGPFLWWAEEKLGRARIEQMRIESHQYTKFRDYQLLELVKYFNGKADELLGKREGAA